jgi:hypothetical protein
METGADREQGGNTQRTRFRPKRPGPTNAKPKRAIVTGSGVAAVVGLCCPACITVAPATWVASAEGAKASNHNSWVISTRFIPLPSRATANSSRLPGTGGVTFPRLFFSAFAPGLDSTSHQKSILIICEAEELIQSSELPISYTTESFCTYSGPLENNCRD